MLLKELFHVVIDQLAMKIFFDLSFSMLENHKISCVYFCFLVRLTVAILSFFIRLKPLEASACGFLLLVCREARRFTYI